MCSQTTPLVLRQLVGGGLLYKVPCRFLRSVARPRKQHLGHATEDKDVMSIVEKSQENARLPGGAREVAAKARRYYAVAAGRETGVFESWTECSERVCRFPGAVHKKFVSLAAANDFVHSCLVSLPPTPTNTSPSHDDRIHMWSVAEGVAEPSTAETEGASDEDVVEVYTDGCCTRNGLEGARGGIGVWWGDDHPANLAEPLNGRQTNSRAEITAAIRAIQQARERGLRRVRVVTDSKFLIKSATSYIHKWLRNDFTKASGSAVVNREDFERLLAVSQGIRVEWQHVYGHVGVPGNENADRLANEGAALFDK